MELATTDNEALEFVPTRHHGTLFYGQYPHTPVTALCVDLHAVLAQITEGVNDAVAALPSAGGSNANPRPDHPFLALRDSRGQLVTNVGNTYIGVAGVLFAAQHVARQLQTYPLFHTAVVPSTVSTLRLCNSLREQLRPFVKTEVQKLLAGVDDEEEEEIGNGSGGGHRRSRAATALQHGVSFYFGVVGLLSTLMEDALTTLLAATSLATSSATVSALHRADQLHIVRSSLAELARHASWIVSLLSSVCRTPDGLGSPTELLFGLAGSLHCLRRVESIRAHVATVVLNRERFPSDVCDDEALKMLLSESTTRNIIETIHEVSTLLIQRAQCSNNSTLDSGNGEGGRESQSVRLLPTWPFHGKCYLGAAHGTVGILFELVSCFGVLRDEAKEFVRDSMHALLEEFSLKNDGTGMPNLNLPVRYHSSRTATTPAVSETIVHWCHGSPGAVFLLLQWFSVSHDTRFLDLADKMLVCIVHPCGVLRKGTGVCHGASGNAYALLAAYRRTRALRYLHLAHDMYATMRSATYEAAVLSYCDPQRRVPNVPDHPLSLMEGIAGKARFLADLLIPETSAFPGFETYADNTPLQRKQSHYHAPSWAPIMLRRTRVAATTSSGLAAATLEQRAPLLSGLLNSVVLGEPPFACLVPSSSGVVCLPSFLSEATCKDVMNYMLSMTTAEDLEERPTRVPIGASSPLFGLLSAITSTVELLANRAELGLALIPSQFWTARQLTAMHDKTKPMFRARYFPPADSYVRVHCVRAYMLFYRWGMRQHTQLHSHADAAHVTFNLCLETSDDEDAGGQLVFEQPQLTSYQHTVGAALVHRSDVPHHTHSVRKGVRVQLVALFEFMDDDALREVPLVRVGGVERLPDSVLSYLFLFVPLRSLATVAVCGSHRFLRILHASAGGSTANYFWCEYLLQSSRVGRLLPIVWSEFLSAEAPGRLGSVSSSYGTRFAEAGQRWKPVDSTIQDALYRSKSLAEVIADAREHSGIDRESRGRCALSRLRRDACSDDEGQHGSFATAPDVWEGVEDAIDWKILYREIVRLVKTAHYFFPARGHEDDGDSNNPDEDDDDTDCATGSDYLSPAVEEELRRLGNKFGDKSMEGCFACGDVLERGQL